MLFQRERRSRAVSPVTEMLRRSMDKASAPLAADRRRVSRQLLTDMNIAQLQVKNTIYMHAIRSNFCGNAAPKHV